MDLLSSSDAKSSVHTLSDGDEVLRDIIEIQQLIEHSKYEPWKWNSILVPLSGITQGWACKNVDRKDLPKVFFFELMAGLVVLFAQIPESIAFALMAGFESSFSLHGAAIVGFISTVFGSRGGVICGVTGSISSVTVSAIMNELNRPEMLFPVLMFAGLYMVIFGFLRLSRIIRFISKSVMIGFCNGLAIIIALSQLHMYTDADDDRVTGEVAAHMAIMTVIAAVSFEFWGKIPVAGNFPAAIVAIGVCISYEWGIVVAWRGLETTSVGDLAAFSDDTRYPKPFWMLPDRLGFDWSYSGADILLAMRYGLIFALIAILESLMTIHVLDDLYGEQSEMDQYMFSIGAANIMSGFLGGMGGNTMMGLSNLLYRCGGSGKEPGIVVALGTVLSTAYFGSFLNYLPTSSLAGIMFVISIHTFSIDSLFMIFCTILPQSVRDKHTALARKIPIVDALIIVAASVLIPLMGMEVGILCGIFISALNFVHQMHMEFQVTRANVDGITRYDIHGPVYYTSSIAIERVFTPTEDNPITHVRMHQSSIMDYSAMEAMSSLKRKYDILRKEFHILHLTNQCENKLLMAEAQLKWAETDMYEMELPQLEAFVNEVPDFPAHIAHHQRRSTCYSMQTVDNSTSMP